MRYGCYCRQQLPAWLPLPLQGGRCERVVALAQKHTLLPICPEQLGGLPTPRLPSEIVGDRVVMRDGSDVTAQYAAGAAEALSLARMLRADFAILKANSPSCGRGQIYDGSFTGQKTAGNGVTAQLFLESGIPVYTENDWPNWPVEE